MNPKAFLLKIVFSCVFAFTFVELGKFQEGVILLLSMTMFFVWDFVMLAERRTRR